MVLRLVAAIMTVLCIACGEDTNPKHRVSFSTDLRILQGHSNREPSAKSFYQASYIRTRRIFKVYISNIFNNNILINANVLLKSYKQQKH